MKGIYRKLLSKIDMRCIYAPYLECNIIIITAKIHLIITYEVLTFCISRFRYGEFCEAKAPWNQEGVH